MPQGEYRVEVPLGDGEQVNVRIVVGEVQ
jgi:hypothetical protein